MIFQDPLSCLHPFYTIGKQLVEAVRVHQDVSKDEARKRAIAMLDRVGIPNPDRRIDDYPHQLSGGMRQRVMIAMALLNDPSLLIADEPTTALDVTVQAQILELLKDLQREFNTAIIIITHDLGVVADVADEVVVMYGGRLVEHGSVDDIFYRPEMPYTLGLLASMPRLDRVRTARLDPIPGQPPSLINLPKGCVFRPRCTYHELVPDGTCDTERPDLRDLRARARGPLPHPRRAAAGHRRRASRHRDRGDGMTAPAAETTPHEAKGDPILRVSGLKKHFPITSGVLFKKVIGEVQAVDGIDLHVYPGETLGLVGESGCGKSTAGRIDAAPARPRPRARSSSTATTSRDSPARSSCRCGARPR